MTAYDIPALTIWTVYEHPRDHPDGFVLREWYVGQTPVMGPAHYVGNLEMARNLVPAGLYRMDRQHSDDCSIVESWI